MGLRSDLEAEFDYDLVDEFIDHYALMTDSMEILILDLEKSEMRKRGVDELFRIFHNIKSASGYLKILPMNKLASFIEDELQELRTTDKKISIETTNWLLKINDMFMQWQKDLKTDSELSKIKYSLLKIPDMEK